ncbi:MAG TPA: HAD family hydrolase, partial [Spirochaetia bacterium]|nr:HAD family hydrolase [Spirochaetia bacterium]
DECFVSSWIAYFNLYLERRPAYMPISLRRDFARMRPLVRGGEDFMLIQEILEKGGMVSRQEDFDAMARRAGPEKLRKFHELFYRARTELLETDRQSWLGLNRVYPHVVSAFQNLSSGAPVSILSTKKPDFIAEILTAKGISLPRERILYSAQEKKLDIVARVGAESGSGEVVFIDDQIDHLLGASASSASPRIEVFLATWGYVQDDWLSEPLRVPIITPREFLALVQREYS